MVIGKINPGSGLGDQLFSYIITRVIALDKGYEYGFIGKEFFKGKEFMNLDWGIETDMPYFIEQSTGKLIAGVPTEKYNWSLVEFNKPYYDPEVNFIKDWTIIDGYGAQDIRYFEHRLDEIREWLNPDDKRPAVRSAWENFCVINFRGGEYQSVRELFLPQEYWNIAIETLDKINPKLEAEVHTDDSELAKKFFNFKIVSGIQTNWWNLRNAKYAIISNSAFAIIPRLIKHLEDPEAITIAPKYWAGRNVGEWRRPQNYYKKFTYI